MNRMLGLSQSQRQTLSQQTLRAADMLELTNAGLHDYLAGQAAANPYLRLRRTRPAGRSLGAAESASIEQTLAEHAPGLHEHVLRQIGLCAFDAGSLALALAFAEALEPSGWLGQPVAAVAAACGAPVCSATEVLHALQGLEPTGVFARSLRECLSLQAAERGQLDGEMIKVLDHLELLATGGGNAAIALAAGLPAETVAQCLARIRRMDPKPGAAFCGDADPLREPDLVVSKTPEGWAVALNRASLPAVSLRDLTSGFASRQAGLSLLRKARAEARWLASMVERRNHTVLAVAAAIVSRQSAYLEEGPGRLVPMRLADIAAVTGLHDSSVSRVVKGLLMQTPRGVIAVRSLFNTALPGAGSAGGGICSSSAIRHIICDILVGEPPDQPLSDEAIAAQLALRGIIIARRTVSKFRGLLGIPPAARRRGALQPDKRRIPA